MKLRILAITVVLFLSFSNVSAQISPDLQDRLDQRPNTTRVDVIILNEDGAKERAAEAVRNARGNVTHQFEIIEGVSATVPKVAADNLARREFVREVQPDYNVETVLSQSADTVDAEEVWAQNISGERVDVAVLDTGIEDSTIMDVERQIDYTGEGTDDLNGHGTHVAGIVASPDREYQGIAYGADLFDVKVIDRNGTGKASDVISGLEYAVENGADVATLSLGTSVRECDGTSAISEAVDNTVEEGVTVTVAAGNGGPENMTLNAPGCAEKPITVGSSGGEEVSDFSSRGPTADGRQKPDLVAPGERITSLTSNRGDGPKFETLSGTSMATPHVAGAAALLLAEENMNPSEIKRVVRENSEDLGYSSNAQGAGRLNVYAVYQEISNRTEENQTQNRSDSVENNIPDIEPKEVEISELNKSLEAELGVEVSDSDNDSLEITFYFEGEPVSNMSGYGELYHTESNLSMNSSYTWRAEVSDGINTSSTGRLEFTTGETEEDRNRTSNRSEKKLPPQASDTARKATSGFFNPNSPFYSIDVAVDRASVALGLRSRESVMEERAQEARSMAERGNEEGAIKAIKNLRDTSGDSGNASREASETLEKAIENSPEEAKKGLRKALENVEKEREGSEKTERRNRSDEKTPNKEKKPEKGSEEEKQGIREKNKSEDRKSRDQAEKTERRESQELETPVKDNKTGSERRMNRTENKKPEKDEKKSQTEENSRNRSSEESKDSLTQEEDGETSRPSGKKATDREASKEAGNKVKESSSTEESSSPETKSEAENGIAADRGSEQKDEKEKPEAGSEEEIQSDRKDGRESQSERKPDKEPEKDGADTGKPSGITGRFFEMLLG